MARDFLNWAAYILAAAILGAGLAVATKMVVANHKWFAVVISTVLALRVWLAECIRRYVLDPRNGHGHAASTLRTQELDATAFDDLTNKIIDAAISDGVVPNDAICATARALGVLVAFTARRENVDHSYLLAFVQQETGEYSKSAEGFMRGNRGLWDRYAPGERLSTEAGSTVLYDR